MTLSERRLPSRNTSATMIACLGILELRGQTSLSTTISSANPNTGLHSQSSILPEIRNPADTFTEDAAVTAHARLSHNARAAHPNT